MPTQDDSLGPCGRVLNEKTEEICSKPAVAEVLVRTKFGLMVARLCKEDYAAHRAYYARLNKNIPKRGRNQLSYPPNIPPANRSPHSTPGSYHAAANASPSIRHLGFGTGLA